MLPMSSSRLTSRVCSETRSAAMPSVAAAALSFSPDVGQHQPHPLAGGALRQGEADAAGGARNDGGLVAKILHDFLPAKMRGVQIGRQEDIMALRKMKPRFA